MLLAAVLAQGTTEIVNAAREPEIVDLCGYLNACGARITGQGEGCILIEGVDRLAGCRHRVIPDRIEAATYMAAAAVTGGSLFLKEVEPIHLAGILPAFEEAGCQISQWEKEILHQRPGPAASDQIGADHALSGFSHRRPSPCHGHGLRGGRHQRVHREYL